MLLLIILLYVNFILNKIFEYPEQTINPETSFGSRVNSRNEFNHYTTLVERIKEQIL